MKLVMAFGTFDHFHAGHESYLKQAKAMGDELIVVVARDETSTKLKGRSPDFDEDQRMDKVIQSGIADKVILGETGNKYEVIRKHKPDIIAFGYDQFAFTYKVDKFLIDNGLDAKTVRLQPYSPNIFKSSLIRSAKCFSTP